MDSKHEAQGSTEMSVMYRRCSRQDKSDITNFLWSLRDELLLLERSTAAEITRLLFEKGGIAAGYQADTLVAMLGYFFGEPRHHYRNKEVGFIYVTGITKCHRFSRLIWNGMYKEYKHNMLSLMKESVYTVS